VEVIASGWKKPLLHVGIETHSGLPPDDFRDQKVAGIGVAVIGSRRKIERPLAQDQRQRGGMADHAVIGPAFQ
jgi:hypothetical protein